MTPAPSLTPREYECLRIYARTGLQKVVAEEMAVSTQTVKNHLANAYRKLDVGTAISAYVALGWLVLPDKAPPEARYEWRLVAA